MTDEFEPSEAEVKAAVVALCSSYFGEARMLIKEATRAALRAAAKVREQGNG